MFLHSIETSGQLQPALSQEWLLTNGTGAYSCSTIVECNTRRYHGLLCAATVPPVGRIMALSRIGQMVRIEGSEITHELGVNQFPASFHPRGERYLRRFRVGEIAEWEYEVEGARITKQLQLLLKKNVAMIRYQIDPGNKKLVTHLTPFAALRDFHALRRGTHGYMQVTADRQGVMVREDNRTLHVTCSAGEFVQHHDWWRDHFYGIEADRGQDCMEDLFTPGRFVVHVDKPITVELVASIQPIDKPDWDAELKRRQTTPATIAPKTPVQKKLFRSAGDFIVDRKAPDGTIGSTVIAGYPWFADWGRDTMISLPGLFLTTGRFDEAAKVLSLFAEYVSDGMIPNRFDDYSNRPDYNTVDASLWFIHACFEYLRTSRDQKLFDDQLKPACLKIFAGYRDGTRFDIKMDPGDGLISQGNRSTQLTWMDAKCNNIAFTPREGKAVEINALWYNALKLLGEFELAEKVRKSFAEKFWISPFRGLCDVITNNHRDTKIRPNQIFAVSLPNSPLSREQQQAVVEVVRRELLTPYGLRTLATKDPEYRDRYGGMQFNRDQAYHNGTIWPWLIGGFLEAYLKVHNRSAESITQVKAWLKPLLDAMDTHGCIGSISEIYEALPPHRPVGCFAQAWSIAEVLRIAVDVGM